MTIAVVEELRQVAAVGINGVVGQIPLRLQTLEIVGDRLACPYRQIGEAHNIDAIGVLAKPKDVPSDREHTVPNTFDCPGCFKTPELHQRLLG